MEDNNLIEPNGIFNGFCEDYSDVGSFMRIPCGKCGLVHPAICEDYNKTPHDIYLEQRANDLNSDDMLEKDSQDDAMVIFSKEYHGFEDCVDIFRDVSEMFDRSLNPDVADLPGEFHGTVTIKVTYHEPR